jgi:hypothetical protein
LLPDAQNFPQGLTNFESAIVVNVPLLPETIHEDIDPRARGPDHFREDLVANDWNFGDWWAVPVQVSQLKKNAREAAFR